MGPPPSPPGGGGGGGVSPLGIPHCILPSGSCQDFSSKIFSRIFLAFYLVKCKDSVVNKKWIPRSLRWTDSERQEKKIQAKNAREIRLMFWRESQVFREKIQKEISEKLLAKRAAYE